MIDRPMAWIRALVVAGALLLALTPSAGAAPNRPFLPAESLPRKGVEPTSFDNPCGVALDGVGDLYVADFFSRTIFGYEVAPYGVFDLAQLQYGSFNGACDLAAGPQGTLYLNDYHGPVTRVVPAAYPPPSSYGPPTMIDPGPATGVAIAAAGRLFVAHRTHVSVYEPDGSPVLDEGEPLRIGEGSLGDGYGVAVSSYGPTAGRVYVADAADGTVKAFDPAGGDPSTPVQVIDGAGTAEGGFVDLADADIAVDPVNGHVLVVDDREPGVESPAAVVYEFTASGEYRGQLPHAAPESGVDPRRFVHARPSGLAVGSNGHLFLTSGSEPGNSAVYAFGTSSLSRRLGVVKQGAGGGTVASTVPGIRCGTACAAEYTVNEAVTLVATPDSGSAFAGWDVAGNPAACPGTGACKVTLSADVAVSAEFESLPASVSASGQAALGVAATGEPSADGCASPCRRSLEVSLSVRAADGRAPALRVVVPSAGSLTATGRGLRRSVVRAAGPESLRLPLRLLPSARRLLAATGRLERTIRVVFSPAGSGSPLSRTKRVAIVVGGRRG